MLLNLNVVRISARCAAAPQLYLEKFACKPVYKFGKGDTVHYADIEEVGLCKEPAMSRVHQGKPEGNPLARCRGQATISESPNIVNAYQESHSLDQGPRIRQISRFLASQMQQTLQPDRRWFGHVMSRVSPKVVRLTPPPSSDVSTNCQRVSSKQLFSNFTLTLEPQYAPRPIIALLSSSENADPETFCRYVVSVAELPRFTAYARAFALRMPGLASNFSISVVIALAFGSIC